MIIEFLASNGSSYISEKKFLEFVGVSDKTLKKLLDDLYDDKKIQKYEDTIKTNKITFYKLNELDWD